MYVLFADGTSQKAGNVNQGTRWPDGQMHTVPILLDRPRPPAEIRGIRLTTSFSGGMGGDNWNLQILKVVGELGSGAKRTLYNRSGNPLIQFTGDMGSRDFIFP